MKNGGSECNEERKFRMSWIMEVVECIGQGVQGQVDLMVRLRAMPCQVHMLAPPLSCCAKHASSECHEEWEWP